MTRASAEGGEARFRISWERGTYKVSIPNYQGGEVVRADVVDELVSALNVLLDEACSFSVSGVYFDEECMGHKGPALARAALAKARGDA